MRVLLALLLLLLVACSSKSTTCGAGTREENGTCVPDAPLTCGAGTVEMNGRCVPTSSGGSDGGETLECGPGTRAMGGVCVPDGTVLCTQGTRFEPDAGRCVVDPAACSAGTTLVNGACVPDEQLLMGAANHVESSSGDAGVAGEFGVPALGASTTFYGCITPDGGVADEDLWVLNASGPAVVEITLKGLGGLAGAFVVIDATGLGVPPRTGIDLSSDTAKREVFLPAAGAWVIVPSDARALLSGQVTGGPGACYFATVKQVPLPAPQMLQLPMTQGSYAGKVQAWAFTAQAEADYLTTTASGSSEAFQLALIGTKGAVFHRAAGYQPGAPVGIEPYLDAAPLANGSTYTIYVDPIVSLPLGAQPFALDSTRIATRPFPVNGQTVTLTEATSTDYKTLHYQWFDVTDAGVKAFYVTSTKPIDMAILRGSVFEPSGAFSYVASIDAFGQTGRTSFTGEYVRFLEAGRYFFTTNSPAPDGGSYAITATVTDVPTTALTYATPSTVSLDGDAGSAFMSIDLDVQPWVELALTASSGWDAGNVSLEAYDLASGGWLRSGVAPTNLPAGNLYPLFSGAQPAVAPFVPMGRVRVGDARDWLVRAKPSTLPSGAAPAVTLQVRDRANVVNLGTLMPNMSVMRTSAAVTPASPVRYLALAAAGDTLRSTVAPVSATSDVVVRRLGAAENVITTFNAGLLGATETLVAPVAAAPGNWVAWSVENVTAATTTDVNVTSVATPPRPYVITAGTLAFVDACTGAGATTLLTAGDDQILTGQTLPPAFSAFPLFGDAVPSTFRIGANGWLSWDTGTLQLGGYQNRPIPTVGSPEGVIAPFWQDQENVVLCRKDDAIAGTVTLQWTGRVYQAPTQLTQFQVRLFANGNIDFIYGPNHAATGAFADSDGNGATVGLESLTGAFGQAVGYNQATVMPNTSRSFVPQ